MTHPNQNHSPLPWRQCPRSPHKLLDASGEPVLLATPSVHGGPHRDIANLDLAERAVNNYESLLAGARLALALLESSTRLGALPDDALQAFGVLRRAVTEGGKALTAGRPG